MTKILSIVLCLLFVILGLFTFIPSNSFATLNCSVVSPSSTYYIGDTIQIDANNFASPGETYRAQLEDPVGVETPLSSDFIPSSTSFPITVTIPSVPSDIYDITIIQTSRTGDSNFCQRGVDISSSPPVCDPRLGTECDTYGCCSASNIESQCYTVYDCGGNCVYGGIRKEGAYCGNGACVCNENTLNCPSDCTGPLPPAGIGCTATSDKATVAPGDTFNITVTWDDGNPHPFNYKYGGTTLVGAGTAASSPYTFTLTAPSRYFTNVNIYNPARTSPVFSCWATVASSAPPPAGSCIWDFSPKSTDGGKPITFTVSQTLAGYSYIVTFNSVSTGTPQVSPSDGAVLTWTVIAPSTAGSYTVDIAAGGPGGKGRQACYGPNPLTVISTAMSGTNPCPGGICHTAIGDINTRDLATFAKGILSLGIGLAGGIALILMVIGSVRVLTSSGDQQKLNGGRDMIIAAISGLLFLIFSALILKFVGISILGLP